MVEPLLKGIARGHGYAVFKTFLEQSQWWSTDRRDAWVARKLKQTLVSALEVPFYRERFAALGFDPRTDLRDAADLARLPVLTRQDIRSEHVRLCAPRFPGTYLTAHTSGTTGEPLELRLSEAFVAFDAACVFRHWSWAGYELRHPIVALRSYVPERPDQPLWRYSRAQNTMFFSAYHLTPQNCELYLDRVLAFRPRLIRGYPSTMALFAEYAYRRRAELAFITGVFTSSETLLQHERETIERTFGDKVFNWYGMTEPALVLSECEQRQGLHVNWEYGYGELVRSDDLPPDEYRLVTTGFHNPVMPLLRYDTGDIVRVRQPDRRCTCGRSLPLVDSIVGRNDERIYTPDGRRLPSVNFYTLFRDYDDVLRFQVAQFGQRELVVRLQPRAGRRLDAATVDKIRAALAARVGPAVSLAIEITDRFITNADGKSPAIVRRPGTRAVEENAVYAISSQTAWTRRTAGEAIHKLDWNEADLVPSPHVREALIALLERDESICWYPPAVSRELVGAIAEYAEVDPDNILVVHGSDAGLELLATSLLHAEDAVVMVTPTYDQCRAIVEQRGARVIAFEHDGARPFDVDAFERTLRASASRLVYLTNPNNPLGYVLDAALLRRIEDSCRRLGSLLVVDEAYVEFSGVSMSHRVRAGSVVVLRTFSKAFGLAGLRIGYVVAPDAVMRALRNVHNPKSVTMFANAAALASLRDLDSVRTYVGEVTRGRERVVELLHRTGARVYPSAANYVLFEWPRATELAAYLDERGILVRDRTAYTGGRGSVRVTIGSGRSVDALLGALASYFRGHGEHDAIRGGELR